MHIPSRNALNLSELRLPPQRRSHVQRSTNTLDGLSMSCSRPFICHQYQVYEGDVRNGTVAFFPTCPPLEQSIELLVVIAGHSSVQPGLQ